MDNIFNIIKLPEKTEDESTDILKENSNIKIERIISTGQVTDGMIQNREEYVILVQGNAVIEFEDRKSELKEGDTIIIRKEERHKVSYTSENPCCIWICIFYD